MTEKGNGLDEENGDLSRLDTLGSLSPAEYGKRRADLAAELNVPVRFIDDEYRERRKATKECGAGGDFLVDPVPWDDPVDGEALLNEIRDVTLRHMILPDASADIVALWSAFSHCHDCFDISPILAVTSPTPECGKTTLLTLLGAIVPRPLPSSNVTAAVIFRAVEKWQPTLIIDEADTFLADNNDLRGIIDSGHNRRNAYVLRSTGDDHEPKQFYTWAPKAIAKIGKMHPTLQSRSIRIELQRKSATEQIYPLRGDRLDHLEPIQRRAARWAADNAAALKASDPEIPSTLHSRMADNWRPLLAIADRAGGIWPERARVVAASSASKSSDETWGVELLGDIQAIFNCRNTDALHSEEIVAELEKLEGRPWPEWGRGKPITKNQMAKLLKPFSIEPEQIKIGGVNKRGYHKDSFAELFDRYLATAQGSQSATPATPLENKEYRGRQSATAENEVAFQKALNPLEINAGSGVAFRKPQDRVCAHCGELGGEPWDYDGETVTLHPDCSDAYAAAQATDPDDPLGLDIIPAGCERRPGRSAAA